MPPDGSEMLLRQLEALNERLELKTDVYRVAETPQEKASMLLDQARTDRRVPLKKQLLQQALDEMHKAQPPPEEEVEVHADSRTYGLTPPSPMA